MNDIFDACVRILEILAKFFGTTYKAINVWIFVVIWPLFTLFLIGLIIYQYKKMRKLNGTIAAIKKNINERDSY